MKKEDSLKRWIEQNSRLFDGVSRFKNLRTFKKNKKKGAIISIERVRLDDFMRPLGSLRVRFSTDDGKEEVFWTKLRKGMKLRLGQRVSIETLHLPASAWDYQFNVVRIDLNGRTVYKWSPKDKLWSYPRC